MAKTIKTYVSDGVRTSYPIDFTLGYLNDRNLVYVYQGDDPTIQLNYTWTDDSNINLDAPVTSGESFNIRRIVPRDVLINDYVDGAQIRERNLDQSYSQALMIIEEIEDGFVTEISPWVLNTVLDLNGNDIINVGTIYVDNIADNAGNNWTELLSAAVAKAEAEAAAAEASATAAAAAETATQLLYDDFNDRYYGPYSSDPLTKPSGAPSTAGDLYFNTTESQMKEYTGAEWNNVAGETLPLYATVAAMKTAPLSVGAVVCTSGYYAVGDLGAGTYEIAIPGSADEYGDHTLTNGNVARLRQSEPIALQQYGVVGDNATDDTLAINAALATGKAFTGRQAIAVTTVNPETLNTDKLTHAGLRYGKVIDFTQGFLSESASKISNGLRYTAWAQDSAYVLNNQVRVWVGQKDAHTDSAALPVLLYSDDNGASYSTHILDPTLRTHSVWSAGVANGKEYVIIRDDSSGPAYTYVMYHRGIPSTGSSQYFNLWSIKALTIPAAPVGTDTVMIHSFTEGHAGSIVVGAHNGSGAWLLRSVDDGTTWTTHLLQSSSNAEEPTVKFHNGQYYGFMRAGNTGNNPMYWHSNGTDLGTISIYTAPAGTFGPEGMADSPVPLQVDADGRVHAYGSYRNGTLEGRGEDGPTSMFYITGPAVSGNFWTTADIHRLAVGYHAETGGASAVGVGSVVIHNDTLRIFGGSEGRTGLASSRDRIADIYQWELPLKKRLSGYDYRQGYIDNRSTPFQVQKLNGENNFGLNARYMMMQRESVSTAYNNVNTASHGFVIDSEGSSSGYGVANDGNYAYFLGYGSTSAYPRGLRIQVSGAAGHVGILSDNQETVRLWDGLNQRLRPIQDITVDCGGPSHRWQEVYSQNAANNTSDATLKEQVTPLDPAWIDTLLDVANTIQMWKWKDSVKNKGDKARWHIGPLAQEVYQRFAAIGVDPFTLSFMCKDVVTEDVTEVVSTPDGGSEEVSTSRTVLNADGSPKEIWGLRHGELQYAIMWAQQQKLNQLTAV